MDSRIPRGAQGVDEVSGKAGTHRHPALCVLGHTMIPCSQFRRREPHSEASRHHHESSQKQEAGSSLISLPLGQGPRLDFPLPSFVQPSPSILACLSLIFPCLCCLA